MNSHEYYTVRYGDIRVHYTSRLDGGGMTFGQQYVDVIREKLGHVEHCFEFCAGPGFIGFSLLAHGLCDKLTVADVNPAAVEACRTTVRENKLEDRVNVYLSDGLESIPESEKWDLVVSNPPHWPGDDADYRENIRLVDPGFAIHRKFYRDVGKHLKPRAAVILQENGHATRREEFVPMIEENGLELVDIFEVDKGSVRDDPNWARKGPSPAAKFAHKIMLQVDTYLMRPGVERFLKDNDVYRKLQKLPMLMPSPYYFIWSRPAR